MGSPQGEADLERKMDRIIPVSGDHSTSLLLIYTNNYVCSLKSQERMPFLQSTPEDHVRKPEDEKDHRNAFY